MLNSFRSAAVDNFPSNLTCVPIAVYVHCSISSIRNPAVFSTPIMIGLADA